MGAFSGGDLLKKRLQEIVAKAGKANTVRVGFLEDATYPDGTPVALIAATNEYGGTVTVPDHDVTVNRKIKADGEFAQNGRFVMADKANFSTTHHVDEYTVTIPSRPFFRDMIQKNKGEWAPDLGKIIKGADYDSAIALGRLGKHVGEQLQESIREFSSPGNAKSTIAKKGFDKALVESSHMLKSVDMEVEPGGGS
ncbi:hypothetical protein [Paraburkholderia gardini]|uniref:hypothetical protein n=1 Tax=Paraburkholderia gardini TaxID=2823469 RepID=UPI001DE22B90|nr:hypothetical protein [Paraburkholderia gardini]CAG4889331.1 hypothetical protein R69919_00715 [Paraburkholderia gardini]